jgi:hypothetical protein
MGQVPGKAQSVFEKLHRAGVAGKKKKMAEIERIEKLKEEVARAQAKPQYPMSQATREMVKNRGKYLMGPDCENYGEMLYIEGQRRIRQRDKDCAEMRERLEQKEMKSVTWKPEITDMARKLYHTQRNLAEPHYRREIAAHKYNPDPETYSFAPETNKKSDHLIKARRPDKAKNKKVHETLFAEAVQRRSRRDELQQQQEVLEQQQLYTVWQQSTFGMPECTEDSGTDLSAVELIESDLQNLRESGLEALELQASPSRSLRSSCHAESPTPQFRSPGPTSQVLDTCMASSANKAAVLPAKTPAAYVTAPVTYNYDCYATLLNKLHTNK